MKVESVNKTLEKSFRDNWWRPAISNYKGETINYAMMAERIEIIHTIFERYGLKKGERVAICGRNQVNWAVSFLGALTYGAVPVPLLHEFNPESVVGLVQHSEARVLFVDDTIWPNLDHEGLKALDAVVRLSDLDFLMAKDSELGDLRAAVIAEFRNHYPYGLRAEDINYYEDKPDELALINYTSGTSGFSKGVMIPYRAIACNMEFAANVAEPQMDCNSNMVSMLPCAHMYGLMFEFLFEMVIGAHVHFLTRMPSPKVIMGAFQEIHPSVIVAVPLIIEKVYKSQLKPVADKLRFFIGAPFIGNIIRKTICKKVKTAFGGEFEEVILGGAAVNPEVEKFFHKIKFPFTVGYGMTECAPIITYEHWNSAKVGSSGKVVPGCQIRIDSPDPKKIPGEVQVRGRNVFLGYYKNEEATKEAFTEDGWFRTGDMGVIRGGRLYLKGRIKCMILSSNGQNIFPEEIEVMLNPMPYVAESIIVSRKDRLVALIVPDMNRAADLDAEGLKSVMDSNLEALNKKIPAYSQVSSYELRYEPFAKTPKGSIKRFMYD